MIHVTKASEVQAYFDNPALNQSTLKKMPDRLAFMNAKDEKKLFYEEKGHFVIGAGVDCMLTQPDDFDNRFYYVEIEKPSDNLMSFAHMIYQSYVEDKKVDPDLERPNVYTDEFKKNVHQALDLISFYNKDKKDDWKVDSRMGRIDKTTFYKYLESLYISHNKQIISISEKQTIEDIAKSLKTNVVTADYFLDKDNCDIYFQKPIYFEYRGYKCKAMLDRLEINHKNKIIFIDDIKSMFDRTINFQGSVITHRYDVQMAWYILAVLEAIIKSKSGRFAEYTIAPPRWIVESSNYVGNPMVYHADFELMHIGKKGRPETSQTFFISENNDVRYSNIRRKIWGYDDMLDELDWYNENGFEQDRLYMESGGELKIDWSKHYLID